MEQEISTKVTDDWNFQFAEEKSWGAYETQKVEEEAQKLGEDILEYAKKYAGFPIYTDIVLAIEFGYQLALKYESEDKNEIDPSGKPPII